MEEWKRLDSNLPSEDVAQLWLDWETWLKEAQLDDYKAYEKLYLTTSYDIVGLEKV